MSEVGPEKPPPARAPQRGLSHTQPLSLSHTHTHSLTHTQPPSLSLTLSLSHTQTLSPSHTHTHTHTHYLSLSLTRPGSRLEPRRVVSLLPDFPKRVRVRALPVPRLPPVARKRFFGPVARKRQNPPLPRACGALPSCPELGRTRPSSPPHPGQRRRPARRRSRANALPPVAVYIRSAPPSSCRPPREAARGAHASRLLPPPGTHLAERGEGCRPGRRARGGFLEEGEGGPEAGSPVLLSGGGDVRAVRPLVCVCFFRRCLKLSPG